jgi:hypothetical protein
MSTVGRTRAEHAYLELRQRIIDMRLPPGAALDEEALMAELGSRNICVGLWPAGERPEGASMGVPKPSKIYGYPKWDCGVLDPCCRRYRACLRLRCTAPASRSCPAPWVDSQRINSYFSTRVALV